MMRRLELQQGIALVDDRQQSLGVQSQKAATEGISAVVLSRIVMAMPGMGEYSERKSDRPLCPVYSPASIPPKTRSHHAGRRAGAHQSWLLCAIPAGHRADADGPGRSDAHPVYAAGLLVLQSDGQHRCGPPGAGCARRPARRSAGRPAGLVQQGPVKTFCI